MLSYRWAVQIVLEKFRSREGYHCRKSCGGDGIWTRLWRELEPGDEGSSGECVVIQSWAGPGTEEWAYVVCLDRLSSVCHWVIDWDRLGPGCRTQRYQAQEFEWVYRQWGRFFKKGVNMTRAVLEKGGSVHVRVSFRKSITIVTRGLVPGLGFWQWELKWVRGKEHWAGCMTGLRDPLDSE